MASHIIPSSIEAYGLSDTGLVRQNNEDVWDSLPAEKVYVLADGMGGHQAGEVASREAILFFLSKVSAFFATGVEHHSKEVIGNAFRKAMIDTNQFVYQFSKTHELLEGMGTTLSCAYFHKDLVFITHVGDSRIYRFRSGTLQQLTKDHSLLAELLELGKEFGYPPYEANCKNVITKAIGTDSNVDPYIAVEEVVENDLYLLCSDGLSDLLDNNRIAAILGMSLTIEEKVRMLIAEAKLAGGYDNITVVIVLLRA